MNDTRAVWRQLNLFIMQPCQTRKTVFYIKETCRSEFDAAAKSEEVHKDIFSFKQNRNVLF